MKKLLFFLFLSTSFSWMSSAKQVDEHAAGKAAGNFYAGVTGMNQVQVAPIPVLVCTSNDLNTGQDAGTRTAPAFYVFNFTHPAGFVIVSGNDICIPILGYSTEGSFTGENMHPGLSGLLQSYLQEIRDVDSRKLNVSPEIEAQWAELLSESPAWSGLKWGTTVVGPLVTQKWDQSPIYNDLCPKDINGKPTMTGCVATAMAMVMKYHNYPVKGIGANTYTTETLQISCTADFGNTTYAWNLMPDVLIDDSASADSNLAVATLMFHCGVSVNINYGTELTSGQTHANGNPNSPCSENALKKYFGYNPSLKGVLSDDYSDDAWLDMLKRDLDETLPIIYGGGTGNGLAHSYICDGYRDNNEFHFNWGWSGKDNGWFALSAIKSTGEKMIQGQDAILRIRKFPEGVNDPVTSGKMVVCPNPARGVVEISLDNGQGKDLQKTIITTMQGQKVYESAAKAENDRISVDLSANPQGNYIVTCYFKSGSKVSRPIVLTK